MTDDLTRPTGLTIETCTDECLSDWAARRAELWPDGSVDEHRQFAQSALGDPTRLGAFIAHDAQHRPLGFAEASLRFKPHGGKLQEFWPALHHNYEKLWKANFKAAPAGDGAA